MIAALEARVPERRPVYARYFLSALIAALLPIALFYTDSYWLKFSYIQKNALFEYFGFSTASVLLFNMIIEIKKRAKSSGDQIIPIVLFGLTGFAFLVWFSEYSLVGNDYSAYQTAAKAFLDGQSIYGHSPSYIYPPLLAYIIAFLYKTVQWISVNIFSTQMKPKEYYYLVFYLYQVFQYGLILVSYGLVYLFAKSLNHTKYSAALLTTLIFLANLPLFRNFRMNQVNLLVLIGLLLAILLVDRNPILTGAFIAFCVHIKIYPIIVLLPWLISRRWLAVGSAIISGILMFLAQLFIANGLNNWIDYFAYIINVEKGIALRNNSLHSLAWNLSHLLFPRSSTPMLVTSTNLLVGGFTALMIAWIVKRYLQRMKAPALTDQDRYLGNFMDTIILMFLISPSAWDHHYVAAIPLAVWAMTVGMDQLIGLVGLGLVFIFWVPTFDVFFFSYVRLAGIVLLMIALQPTKTVIPSLPIEQPLQIRV